MHSEEDYGHKEINQRIILEHGYDMIYDTKNKGLLINILVLINCIASNIIFCVIPILKGNTVMVESNIRQSQKPNFKKVKFLFLSSLKALLSLFLDDIYIASILPSVPD